MQPLDKIFNHEKTKTKTTSIWRKKYLRETCACKPASIWSRCGKSISELSSLAAENTIPKAWTQREKIAKFMKYWKSILPNCIEWMCN